MIFKIVYIFKKQKTYLFLIDQTFDPSFPSAADKNPFFHIQSP